jgi:hypothetical protein
MPENFGAIAQNPFENLQPSSNDSPEPKLQVIESEKMHWLTDYIPNEFSELDGQTQAKILNEYKLNLDTLTSSERIEWLEAFLASAKIDPLDATLLVRSLPDYEERAQIGLYILQVLDVGQYAATFQACWFDLSGDNAKHKRQNTNSENPYQNPRKKHRLREKITQPSTRQSIIDEFITESNEQLHLIAPFVDLHDYNIEHELSETGWQEKITFRRSSRAYWGSVEYTKEQQKLQKNPPAPGIAPHHKQELLAKYGARPETKNLLKDKIINSQQLIQVLDACITFLDEQGWPTLDENHAESKSYQIETYKKAINEIISRAMVTHSMILIPYLPKLKIHGLADKDSISGEDIQERCFKKVSNSYTQANFQTPQEKQREDEIKQQIKDQNPDLGRYDIAKKLREDPVLYPEYLKLQQTYKDRAAKYLVKNFAEVKKIITTKQQYILIQAALDYDFPIFKYLNPADVDDSVRKQILKENLGAVFRDPQFLDLKQYIENGFEDEVAAEVVNSIEIYGEDDLYAKFFIQNIDTVLSWFSIKNRDKILNALKNSTPESWLKNVDFALNNDILSFDDIVNSFTNNPRGLIANYKTIYSQWHKLKKAGRQPEIDIETINQLTKNALQSETVLISDNLKTFQHFFSDEELSNQIYEYLLTSEYLSFSENLIDKIPENPFFKKTVKAIKAALTKRPELFSYYAIDKFKILQKIFTSKEILELAIKNANQITFRKFGSTDFMIFLIEHPIAFQKFCDQILQASSIDNMLSIMSTMNDIKRRDDLLKSTENYKPGGKPLKPQNRQNLNNFYDKLLASILNKSKEDPTLILTQDALYNPDIPNHELTEEMISDALAANPSLLGPLLSSFQQEQGYESNDWGRKFYTTLKDERINNAILKNIRQIAFSSGNSVKILKEHKVPLEIIEQIEDLNPLTKLAAEGELAGDFYQAAIQAVSSNPFYPLFKTKLTHIAESELKRNGPRTDVDYYTPNPDFVSLIRRIQMLQASPPIFAQKDNLLSLNPKDFHDLAPYLEFVSYYNLDKDLHLNLENQSLDEVKQVLAEKIFVNLIKIFGLEDIKNLNEKDLVIPEIKTIEALLIYFTNSCKNNPDMEKAAKKYLTALLQGNVTTWRIWEGPEPNSKQAATKKLKELQQSGLIPEQMSLEQYQTWNQDQTTDLNELLEYGINDIRLGFNQIIDQAIADEHITRPEIYVNQALIQRRHDALSRPITAINSEIKAISKKMQQQKKAKKRGDDTQYVTEDEVQRYEELRAELAEYLEANQEKLDEAKAQLYLNRFQNITIEELETKSLTIGNARVAFSQAFKILEKVYGTTNPDFLQDIRRLQDSAAQGFEKIFGKSKVSRSNLTLTDEFNPMTYIRIGSEPVSSCQSFDSSSDLNYGLLSYSMDPNVRIIQIFDDNQQIITRAALRLLSDEDGNPQLFLERIYSTNAHQKINEAVINFAKEKAKALGVKLFSHGKRNTKITNIQHATLQSSGSRTPFVYTDAGGGKRKNGIYKIQNADQLN